jgi:predicted transcriptional regulator
MNKTKLEKEVARIEKTQGALRESIERTRELAEQADDLIQKHKETLKDEESSPD